MIKLADLNPPLGYPGGICYVVSRIVETLHNPRLQRQLTDEVEHGHDLEGEEAKVYRPMVDKGPGGPINQILFSSHAQYRMDLRSVTVPEVRLALRNFLKHLYDLKSRQDPEFNHLSRSLMQQSVVEWKDPKTQLFISFKLSDDKQVKIITTFWKGEPDPIPSQCKIGGYHNDDLSGFRTFVRDSKPQSDPTYPEQALPSPPNTRSKPVGPTTFNVPSDHTRYRSTPKSRPHPDPKPGVPWLTRQTVQAAVDGEPYPNPKQKAQRGVARNYYKRYYRRYRSKIKNRMKKWYRREHNTYRYKQDQERRRKRPKRFERRPYGGVRRPKDRSKEWRQEKKAQTFLYDKQEHTIDYDRANRLQIPEKHDQSDTGPDYQVTDNPGSAKVIPYNRDFVNNTDRFLAKHAMTIGAFLRQTPSKVKAGAKAIAVSLAKETANTWFFNVKDYCVVVKSKTDEFTNQTDLLVRCSCPYWIYMGPEYHAKTKGYLYGKVKGMGTKPDVRDPEGKNLLCKHIYAALQYMKRNIGY